MNAARPSIQVIQAQRFVEGGGFVVHRPFPVEGLSYVDPVLLIDEMGPVDYAPGEAVGAPDHPHRGFETVTYMIEGSFSHEDSFGHRGSIRSGDVQWMTAGAGVIHAEMPAEEIVRNGGRIHGFQIWINLPKERKLSTPRYQEYPADALPLVDGDGRWVRVIAGEFEGRRSPIETTVPTTMLHVKLQPGRGATVRVPYGSNAMLYNLDGVVSVGQTQFGKRDVGIVRNVAAPLDISTHAYAFEGLILAGMPLGEPVSRYGPFVMNTPGEVQQAFDDYRAGGFGEIARTL